MLLDYGKSLMGRKTIELKPLTNAVPVTIGSGKDQKVVLDDPKCAESHASIRYWDDCFVLMDKEASVQGTLVNGDRIDVCRVEPGDVILIGETELTLSADKSNYRGDVTVKIKR